MTENKVVPKLRFSDFQDEWSKIPFERFIEEYKGGAPLKPKDFVRFSNYEVIPKKAIQSEGKLCLDKDNPTYCTESFFNKNTRNIINHKYLITTLRDLVPSGPSIGFIVSNDNPNPLIMAQGVYGFVISDSLINGFIVQYSNRQEYRKLMQKIMVGSTQVHIRTKDFFRILLTVPKLPEQQKIASFLSAVDEKLQQLTKKKELLSAYKKGVMQQIFSQELRFKDEFGNSYPDWEEKKLGEVGETFNGLTGKTKVDFGIGKPFIQYMQIFNSAKIDTSKFGYVDISEGEKQKTAKYGDVFFTTSSETPLEIGYASVLTEEIEEVYLNSFCFGYRPNSLTELYPDFSSYLFRSEFLRKQIVKLAQGSTRYNMSKVQLMKVLIQLPSFDEQQKIANFLSLIDKKIELISSQIENTKAFKKGLLQQMFV